MTAEKMLKSGCCWRRRIVKIINDWLREKAEVRNFAFEKGCQLIGKSRNGQRRRVHVYQG